jgi:tetratricopeptide (TPR) repeat protein
MTFSRTWPRSLTLRSSAAPRYSNSRAATRNLREIGLALGVAHILEGTARRAGNRIRVNAQLIDARSDAQLWGETFDREITDLFALQSELAQRISQELRANLSAREKTNLQTHPTRDILAYELFLRARELFHWAGSGYSYDKGADALRLIDEAIKRDPQFALAYGLASRLHSELFWFGYDKSASRLEKAKAAADAALELQPDLGEAHLAKAFYYYYGFRQYDVPKSTSPMQFGRFPTTPTCSIPLERSPAESEDGMKRRVLWSRRGIATLEIFRCCGVCSKVISPCMNTPRQTEQ